MIDWGPELQGYTFTVKGNAGRRGDPQSSDLVRSTHRKPGKRVRLHGNGWAALMPNPLPCRTLAGTQLRGIGLQDQFM
jgi:hypothetical protein